MISLNGLDDLSEMKTIEKRYQLIAKKYREFFWPTIAMTMANNLALFVDSVLVSTFLGVGRMPAIQLCFPIVAFVNLFYWMLGIGGSLLASNTMADHDRDKASRLFSVSMFTVVIFGFAVAVLGNLFLPRLTGILCQEPTLMDDVKAYARVLLMGMPFLCFIMSLSYFARADGSPKVGFWAVLISNTINLCMDVVLIRFCGMGLTGAALATLIGYVFGCLYMVKYLRSKKRQMRLVSPIKGGHYFSDLKSICAKGIPTASSQLYIMLRTQILNMIVTRYGGPIGLQVFSIYKNSLFLVYIVFIGTAQTMSPIVSVYNHEGDYDRARYVLKRSVKTALVGGVIIAALFAVFPQIILFLYRVSQPLTVVACIQSIRLYVLSYPGLAFFYIMSYYFQAIKRQRLSAIMTLLEGLVFPVCFIGLLTPAFGMGGLWAGVIAVETVSAAVIILILAAAKAKNREKEEISFLLPVKMDPDRYDFTVSMNMNDAVKLSTDVHEWLKTLLGPSTAMKTALALEEMLTGIVMANRESNDVIDVVMRKEKDEIIISIRDMGVGFNPVVEDENLRLEYDNTYVLQKIASEMKYDRSIGMNSTLIRIAGQGISEESKEV